jgi:pSer/pThr/pTyr-binding forkhead associated (FHA) protein/RNA polymerase subunit RPABC4/transcription elongation factor Spt4
LTRGPGLAYKGSGIPRPGESFGHGAATARMEDYVGIACGQCDMFVPMGTDQCTECGHGLSFGSAGASAGQAPPTPSQEELMEQARHYVCKECQSSVPSGQKFCGACGAAVPQVIQDLQTDYFGAMQAPGKARLILIRGDQGVDGLTYLLQGTEHVAGRQDSQILFPDDAWISPRHANFVYREGQLVVTDEGSKNGVYVRVKEPVQLERGDVFLCGQELFRLDAGPTDTAGPGEDQTYFYASPHRPCSFRLVQLLENGAEGMVICARENSVQIGREDCDLNFPEDIYMSGTHAKVHASGGDRFTLTDLGSRNGTYVRIRSEHALTHGDYLFVGHQLLRVEITA